MSTDEQYMLRCLELAELGMGKVAPNPMVGAILVHDDKIIGEGYHQEFGGPHAEVNAINNCDQPDLLPQSTLYVNLEPCCHEGKTPACTNLIIEKKIPKVVIGCIDPNPQVAGNGVKQLTDTGIDVTQEILKETCDELNKRFFTFHKEQRPYVILKWAQSINGYIGETEKRTQISNEYSLRLSHRWRSEEMAILVGTNTARIDDPELTTRLHPGKNPLRLVIDRALNLPKTLKLFDGSVPTIVFTEQKKSNDKVEYCTVDFNDLVKQVLHILYQKGIQSLIVEGGAQLINSFIDSNLWDEARVSTSKQVIQTGVAGPKASGTVILDEKVASDSLTIYKNQT